MTDSELIDLYWQRREDAITATDKAYGRFCRSISRHILSDPEDAEEVVNDTYWKVWNLIPPQRPDPFRGFLGRITRQLSINRLESNTAQKRGSGEFSLALEELGDVAAGESLDMAEQLVLREVLEQFLKALPEKSRRLFLLRYWYFLSIKEIAGQTGLTQSNVKMQLLRTREKLRDCLQKEVLL